MSPIPPSATGPDATLTFALSMSATMAGLRVAPSSPRPTASRTACASIQTGRVWTSAGAGVNVYTPDASLIGRIGFPADVTNLTFGGAGKDQLFVTAGSSLYVLPVLVTGAQWP